MKKRQIMQALRGMSLPKIVIAVSILVLLGLTALIVRQATTSKPGGYAVHDGIAATIFWIGEPADDSNDQISNVPTAWDDDARQHFGGDDGPSKKDGEVTDVPRDDLGIVTSFRPLHNPYYFALPAAEFGNNGVIKKARESSPWHNQTVGDNRSLFKGRWARISSGGKTIYAQWLDVGPNAEDDYGYVFGDGKQKPKNTFGLKAGIDLSPAAAITLGFSDDSRQVSWQFVDSRDVPEGPWKQYPAISNLTYWN